MINAAKLQRLGKLLTKNDLAYKYYVKALRKFTTFICAKSLAKNGVKVVNEDWDYLIVLDAARYDIFKKINWIKGNLEYKISLGSCTREWLQRNFSEYYDDIIYISANPFISNIGYHGFYGSKHFYKVISCWDFAWNDKLKTVHPKDVVQTALRYIKKHPDKRFIIHFIQPHAPYIGVNILPKDIKIIRKEDPVNIIAKFLREGRIPVEKAIEAYIKNLIIVLRYVEKLINKLEGKIIITSDHGEAFGENLVYFHPCNIYIKELIIVPWLVINKGRRIRMKYKYISNKIKKTIRKRVEPT